MLAKFFKICGGGCLVVGFAITLLSGTPKSDSDLQGIWSVKEVSEGNSLVSEEIYTMQGAEPIDSLNTYDCRKELEGSICELEDAMAESVEIMRSLKIESADMLENEIFEAESLSENKMYIEDFKMQNLQGEQEGIGRNRFEGKVVADVDISIPSLSNKAIIDQQELGELSSLNELKGSAEKVIPLATLKVVDILFEHGEDERALTMLEDELQSVLIN